MFNFLRNIFVKKPLILPKTIAQRPTVPIYADPLVHNFTEAFKEWSQGTAYSDSAFWQYGLVLALEERFKNSNLCPDCQTTHNGLVAAIYAVIEQVESWWAQAHAPTYADVCNLKKGDFSQTKSFCARCAQYGKIIARLEHKLQNVKREVTQLNEALRHKNLALDAQHYVWCDGGCPGGTHRYTENKVTEEIVQEAERQVKRLRSWWNSKNYKQKYAEECAKKK